MKLPRAALASCVAVLALAGGLPAEGQTPQTAPQETPKTGIEPKVQNIVVEDDNARIEELRVRGQTQRITVQPKGGAKGYEILPASQGRDMSESAGSQRGAAGKRVWNVLTF